LDVPSNADQLTENFAAYSTSHIPSLPNAPNCH
jgi:hypothetical protein